MHLDKSTLGATETVGFDDGRELSDGYEVFEGKDDGSEVNAFVGSTDTVGDEEKLGSELGDAELEGLKDSDGLELGLELVVKIPPITEGIVEGDTDGITDGSELGRIDTDGFADGSELGFIDIDGFADG